MIDPNTETWKEVDKWACEALKAARLKLETTGLDEKEYDVERGKIETLKTLILLTDDKPEIPEAKLTGPY